MNARWNRIRGILDEVSDLEAGEREAALLAACGDDRTLFAEIQGLLAREDSADAVVGGIVARGAWSVLAPIEAGARVGPYRIAREIGHGGMGTVFLAERVDGGFDQQVALKLIRPGLNTRQFLRRFDAERQLHARLQHPNIARLLDGGVDVEGRPYFALEYVEGEPIDRYCDRHSLTVDQRLALLEAVGAAVMHAHSSLVVHRDLKPAHILVTAAGQVRLIDFGIAKALTDDEPGLTQAGLRAMTPEYASPEQLRGQPAGTGADVYALGVILYELLAGVRPHDLDGRTPAEIERIVGETEPEKPSAKIARAWGAPREAAARFGRSRGATLGRVRTLVGGDLDLICLKALQKDPARRYASVEALLEDLRRHRASRPVLARPDSAAYRLRRYAARHRAGLAMTAAGILVLAAIVTFYTVRLARERDSARRQAVKAEQVSRFLEGIFEVSDPSESKGRTVTARELLDEGAARIEQELKGQPEVRASMMRVIGDVYHGLGLYATGKPLLERALAEQRRLFGPSDVEVAESEEALGTLLQSMGDVEAAEPLLRQSLATLERVYGPRHERVSQSLVLVSFMLETKGDFAEAERTLRRALEIDRALFAPGDARVVRSKAKLAGLLRRLDRLDEAEPLLRDALAAQRAIYGNRDLTVAGTIRNLASLLRDREQFAEAETLYREAIAIRREILGDAHPDVAIVLNSYALLLDRQGRHADAAKVHQEFIGSLEQASGGRPHPDLAAGYSNLAAALKALGRLDDAAAAYRRSIAIGDEVIPTGHPNRAFPRIGLASVYLSEKNFAAAEPLIREALRLRRAGLPAHHRYIGDTIVELGVCLSGLARFAEAERAFEEALTLFTDTLGAQDERTVGVGRRLEALRETMRQPRSGR